MKVFLLGLVVGLLLGALGVRALIARDVLGPARGASSAPAPPVDTIEVRDLVVLASEPGLAHAVLPLLAQAQPVQPPQDAAPDAGVRASDTPATAPSTGTVLSPRDEPLVVIDRPIDFERVLGMHIEVTGHVRSAAVPSVSGLALAGQHALRETWVRARGRVRRLPPSSLAEPARTTLGEQSTDVSYALDELEVLEVRGAPASGSRSWHSARLGTRAPTR